MICDSLIPTIVKKTLSIDVIWRVVKNGWSITRNGFLGECSCHFKQKEKLEVSHIIVSMLLYQLSPSLAMPGHISGNFMCQGVFQQRQDCTKFGFLHFLLFFQIPQQDLHLPQHKKNTSPVSSC